MSVFNLSNAIMGSGILGLAYAMSNTGIIMFLILLTFIAILSAYSIHLLLKSAGVVGIRAYEQLGKRAFGKPGKVLAAAIICMHNIGAMSSYLFIVKYELPLVIQTFLGKTGNTGEWYINGNYLIIIVSVTIILPLALMKQLGYLGYTSGFSLTCMVFFLFSVIYKKFNIPCPLESEGNATHYLNDTAAMTCEAKTFTYNSQVSHTHTHTHARTHARTYAHTRMHTRTHKHTHVQTHAPTHTHTRADARNTDISFSFHLQTVYTIPILAFAFVCHPEVLPIYTELRSATKKRMQNVANISILAMFVMYLLTALFGYLTFYGNVEAELLHTYSKVDPLDTLILCVRLSVLVAVTLTVPVVLFPIRRAIQQLLFPRKEFHWVRHILIAITLLIIVNLLVIFVPNIRDIFGIIGDLIFILPGSFYVRIVPNEREPLRSRPKIQAICFAVVGVIFMVMSTSFIISDWVTGEKNSGGGH
ncbi:S38A3 protein, partial [Amia calva]|nr:S38A3 protein [Amia calva]